MRSRTPSPEHQEAVARRLELLSAELASLRPVDPGGSSSGDTRVRAPYTHTRVREPAPLPVVAPEEPVAPVLVAEPGRHAARRPRDVLAAVVPEAWRGRVALGPGQVATLAVIVAAGLAVACWWVVRSTPQPVAVPDSLPLSQPTVSEDPAGGSASTPEVRHGKVVVDVAGAVRHPGIAELRDGSRVVDALRAAGGARPGVDLTGLNLARVLVDGEQIVVGGSAPPSGAAASAPATGGTPTGTLVNLNTADETTLESLPEVGPVTAQSIIAWRTEHGGFTSVDELLEVDGIGDATLAKLTPYVTV